jgi:hypothetical protein
MYLYKAGAGKIFFITAQHFFVFIKLLMKE